MFGVRCNKTHGGFAVRYKKTTANSRVCGASQQKSTANYFFTVCFPFAVRPI
jgi:hypothetical protein